MTCAGIHIGTSGWAYHEWRGPFYPLKARSEDLLCLYAEVFACVEITSTAYRTPTVETVARWRRAMPAGFRAAVKMPHMITHRRQLKNIESELTEFITAVRFLEDRRGPVLVQLPPNLRPDHRLLHDFIQLAQGLMADPAWRLVVEIRHPGWISATTERLLEDLHVVWCLADNAGCIIDHPTNGADLVYLRRHGTAGPYHGSYDEADLYRDAELLRATTRHGAEAFVFFNNTADMAAVFNARRLGALLEESPSDLQQVAELHLTAGNDQP